MGSRLLEPERSGRSLHNLLGRRRPAGLRRFGFVTDHFLDDLLEYLGHLHSPPRLDCVVEFGKLLKRVKYIRGMSAATRTDAEFSKFLGQF